MVDCYGIWYFYSIYCYTNTLNAVSGYIDTEVSSILTDTNELQTDWANGGRLDLL